MGKWTWSVLSAAVLATGLLGWGNSAEGGWAPSGWGSTPAKGDGPSSYTVVKIVEAAGKVSFEAIEAKELEKRIKAADEAYTKALKAWEEAAKADPDAPKPVKVAFTTLKEGIKGTGAKAVAEAEAARCKAEYEKKLKEAAGST